MIKHTLLNLLKKSIPQSSWSWVVSAMRQDRVIWQGLQDPSFLYLLERNQYPFLSNPENWSPGKFALIALQQEHLVLPDNEAIQPLEKDLLEKVQMVYARPASELGGLNYFQAGLMALGLREYRRRTGSWADIQNELIRKPNSEWYPVLACVYGLIPDPDQLIRALLLSTNQPEPIKLAVHAMLCNPMPLEQEHDLLTRVIEQSERDQRFTKFDRLVLLEAVSKYSSQLAVRLSQSWVELTNLAYKARFNEPEGISDAISDLREIFYQLEINGITENHERSLSLIDISQEHLVNISRQLFAKKIQFHRQHDPTQMESSPDIPDYLIRINYQTMSAQQRPDEAQVDWAIALIDAGDITEAHNILSGLANQDSNNYTQKELIALSAIALSEADAQKSRDYAEMALENLEQKHHISTIISPNPESHAILAKLARLFVQLDLPTEAVRAAELALEQYPNDYETIHLEGDAAKSSFQLELAVQAYQLAVCLKPDRIDVHRSLAESLEAAGDWQAALDERKEILQTTSDDPQLDDIHALAKCALFADELTLAQQVSFQAIAINSQDGLSFAYLGEIYYRLGEYPKAAEYIQNAIQYSPNLPEPWLAQARIQTSSGQTQAAIETLCTATQALPNSPAVHYELGKIYRLENALTLALNEFKIAAELAPNEIQISLCLGQVLRQLGHIEAAELVLHQAYQKSPTLPELAYEYAQVLIAQNKLSSALQPLEIVINNQSITHIKPWLDYAQILLSLPDSVVTRENSSKAIIALNRALELDAGNLEVKVLLAEALEIAGEWDQALIKYQEALDTKTDIDRRMLARLCHGLGKVALKKGKLDIAIASLQEAIHSNPENVFIHRTLSEAYLEANLAEETLHWARSALNIGIDNIDTLIWFADQVINLFQRSGIGVKPPVGDNPGAGILSEAINAINQALQIEPDNPDLLLRLGKLHQQVEDHSSAILTLRRIASLDQARPIHLRNAASLLALSDDTSYAIFCLEKALANCDAAKQEDVVDLYIELVRIYRKINDHTSALKYVNQALDCAPFNQKLYELKASIYISLNQIETAIQCIEETLNRTQPDLSQLNLLYLAAIFSRMKGSLSTARAYTERGINIIANALQTDTNISTIQDSIKFNNLLANIYTASLLTEKARTILNDNLIDNTTPSTDWVDYQNTRAELAFEVSEFGETQALLANVLEYDPTNPRALALQARLINRMGDVTQAQTRFLSALEFFKTKPLQINHPGITDSPRTYMTSLAVSIAGTELYQWDAAILFARMAVEIYAEEPLSQLNYSRVLITRAEHQRLCDDLEVINHSPGTSSIAEYSKNAFQESITKARQSYQSAVDASQTSVDPLVQPEIFSHPGILHWRLRGNLVFAIGMDLVDAINQFEGFIKEQTSTSNQLDSHDTAAYLLALRRDNRAIPAPLTNPGSLSSGYKHPAVLRQIALGLESKHPAEAFQTIEYLLENHPSAGMPWSAIDNFYYARLAYKQENLQAATNGIDMALDSLPDESRWHALAAKIYTAAGDPSTAIFHLEEAVRLEPSQICHLMALSEAYLGTSQSGHPNLKQALQCLERASRLAPERTDVWLALAKAQMQVPDYPQALNSIERALLIHPDNVSALILRARLALLTQNAEEAYAISKEAIRHSSNDEEAVLIASQALQDLNRPTEALELLENTMPFVVNLLPLQLEQIKLLKYTQGPEAALHLLEGMVNQYPDDGRVLSAFAQTLAQNGQHEAAVRSAQRAIRSGNGNLNPLDQYQMQLLLGKLLSQSGQLDQAIYHLDQAIQLMPNSIEPYLELGNAHQSRRQYRQALRMYEKAASIAPNDPRPHYLSGITYKEGKDYKNAESMFRRAATLAPNDVNIRRQLAAVIALNLVHNPKPVRISD